MKEVKSYLYTKASKECEAQVEEDLESETEEVSVAELLKKEEDGTR